MRLSFLALDLALARFFAENVTVQSGALERTIMDAATATTGADVVLVT